VRLRISNAALGEGIPVKFGTVSPYLTLKKSGPSSTTITATL
jgi:hypothetical protein